MVKCESLIYRPDGQESGHSVASEAGPAPFVENVEKSLPQKGSAESGASPAFNARVPDETGNIYPVPDDLSLRIVKNRIPAKDTAAAGRSLYS